jgi:hypothetical protein
MGRGRAALDQPALTVHPAGHGYPSDMVMLSDLDRFRLAVGVTGRVPGPRAAGSGPPPR